MVLVKWSGSGWIPCFRFSAVVLVWCPWSQLGAVALVGFLIGFPVAGSMIHHLGSYLIENGSVLDLRCGSWT